MILELHECFSTLTDYAKGLRSVGVETYAVTLGCFEANRDLFGQIEVVLLIPDPNSERPSGDLLRALATLARVPTLAAVHPDQAAHAYEWLASGVHAFVQRQTARCVIAQQIRALAELSAAAPGSPLYSPDLTRIERRILALISSRPGHAFSRGTILQHIYDDHRVVCPRTVDAHVKNLRRKLSNHAVVRSAYGEGYVFETARKPT
jgi:DNA-binding NarL/FixJ family response regulator